MTVNRLHRCAPADIVSLLRQTLHSHAYAARLETIHAHYHNSKNESRYRDALLEEFNAAPEAVSASLRAYAEADKIDMVVTCPDMLRDGWVRVELKYQFAYDLACRVRSTLDRLRRDSTDRTVRQQLDALPKCDLQRIVLDCIGRDGDSDADLCHVFVLVVQDRRGATHPGAVPPQIAGSKGRTWVCPELDTRGVTLQFLHEQIALDARYETRASYEEAWRDPTWEMLKLIHGLRPFNLQLATHTMSSPGPFPLTSYLFTLDFTGARPFPENSQELFGSADQARQQSCPEHAARPSGIQEDCSPADSGGRAAAPLPH